MKKKSAIIPLAASLLLVAYNLAVFVLPVPRTGSFWIAYIMTILAFLLQFGGNYAAYKSGFTLKSAFLGLSVERLGGLYLLIQLVWSATVMAFLPSAPIPAAVVGIVLHGWFIYCMIMTS